MLLSACTSETLKHMVFHLHIYYFDDCVFLDLVAQMGPGPSGTLSPMAVMVSVSDCNDNRKAGPFDYLLFMPGLQSTSALFSWSSLS